MCKASLFAKNNTQAKTGDHYTIGLSPHGLGALTKPGVSPEECIACVQTGSILAVSGVHPQVQRDFGIEAAFKAVFIQTEDDCDDFLRLPDRREIDMWTIGQYGAEVNVLYAAPWEKADLNELTAAQTSERQAGMFIDETRPSGTNEERELATAFG